MKKILIAYDGSAGAEIAVTGLLRAGLPGRAAARILTIADVWLPADVEGTAGPVGEHPLIARAREHATELMHTAAQTAVRGAQLVHQLFPYWDVENTARADSPAWGIVAEARNWQADLIVIGAHSRTPLEKFFLGSVSHKVALEADCAVRIERARPHTTDSASRILIALDGSPDSRRAAAAVVERHWVLRTDFELVTVIDSKMKSRIFARSGQMENPHAADRIEDQVRSIQETVAQEFNARGLEVNCHVLEGDPKTRLLDCARDWHIDTLFLGAHGVEHGDRRSLGTLASALCSRTQCSVEIARPPREATGK